MSMFRSLLMASGYTPRLPREYQEVEYIKSTGTQYMDTGISCAGGIKCEYKASFQSYGFLCGSHNTSSPYGRCGAYVHSDRRFEFSYGNTYNKAGTASLNTLYEVEYQTTYSNAYLKVKGGIYDDWTQIYTTSGQTVSTNNALIFANQYAITYGEPRTQAVLYYLKVYNSAGELKGDFVPCYKKSNNQIGLYNLVNDTFITNLGTGSFIKGPNIPLEPEPSVLPSEYQKVEYIKTHNAEYIDTGIIANQDTGFEIDYITYDNLSQSGFGSFFGARSSWNSNGFHLTTYTENTTGGHLLFNAIRYSTNIIRETRQQISLKNKELTTANGNVTTLGNYTFTTPVSLYIFALHETNLISEKANMRLYSLKFYDGDTLIRKYVPCYRKSDNVIGLYDLVQNEFKTNIGTGTFEKGADV